MKSCKYCQSIGDLRLRRETSAIAQTIGTQSSRQVALSRVALSRKNYLIFEIYSTDESGRLN
ncbi:hypothetical protein QUA70_23065 [Microcoleus sp. LAD1_D5]|uniref:hypothetical protein n=1 Tax=unclassified Microcoleus TaxID=2642155 RepID=UPI002FD628CE